MKTFTCSYEMDGAKWALDIKAESHADAMRRLNAIADTGKVDGEVMLTIPAGPSWFWKLLGQR